MYKHQCFITEKTYYQKIGKKHGIKTLMKFQIWLKIGMICISSQNKDIKKIQVCMAIWNLYMTPIFQVVICSLMGLIFLVKIIRILARSDFQMEIHIMVLK